MTSPTEPHQRATAPLDISQLAAIEITYVTADRFGLSQDGDPHEVHAQRISARIEGLLDDYETRVQLGSAELARIDIWEAGSEILDVLDSASGEWTTYWELLREEDDDPAGYETLLIVDRAELSPHARGHGIAVHAIARAIRTWASSGNTLVTLIAYPPGGKGADGRRGGEALARYWARLGLERVPGSDPPLLYASTGSREFDDTLRGLCRWSPAPS